jgi:hypothetical protein
VLSTHRACAGVSGARGVNGPGCGDGGVGSGVGFGRGGTDATLVDGAVSGAGLPAHEMAPANGASRATEATARIRVDVLGMCLS